MRKDSQKSRTQDGPSSVTGKLNWRLRNKRMVKHRRLPCRNGRCGIASLNLAHTCRLASTSMRNKHQPMKLSRDEDVFLRHWMYDEVHYADAPGPAKRAQLEQRAVPADLALIIAAAVPDFADQERIGIGPPPVDLPLWPWTVDTLRRRVAEAREVLASRKLFEINRANATTASSAEITPIP